MTQEQRALVRELNGAVCFCGRAKRPAQTFCRNCYYSLPEEIRTDLYKRVGFGYEAAYAEARKCLGEAAGRVKAS